MKNGFGLFTILLGEYLTFTPFRVLSSLIFPGDLGTLGSECVVKVLYYFVHVMYSTYKGEQSDLHAIDTLTRIYRVPVMRILYLRMHDRSDGVLVRNN